MIKTILFKKWLIIFNSSNQTATRGNPKLIRLRIPIDGNRCSRSIGIRNWFRQVHWKQMQFRDI